MNAFATEVASSPAPGITIYRTLVDGNSVLLHSRYEGLKNAPGPLLAMDLFRFDDDTVVEHWGGQQPASPDRNLSGHTQVDGPTAVVDRERTEANRALIQTYRETITVLTPRYYVADGNFVLSAVDARTDPPKVNYDLFRVADGKIAEHWEVLSAIPPRDQWKNPNGPF
jgi:predicted SnoaL-like aldol condensation-catalyzing enzyme